jgi:hypothetical protein
MFDGNEDHGGGYGARGRDECCVVLRDYAAKRTRALVRFERGHATVTVTTYASGTSMRDEASRIVRHLFGDACRIDIELPI